MPELRCRILHAARTVISGTWKFTLHDPFWRIYLNDRSGASVTSGSRVHILVPGRIHVLPAWIEYRTRCAVPVRHWYLHVDPVGLDGAWARGALDRPLALGADADLVRRLRAVTEAQNRGTAWHARVQAVGLETVAAALELLPASALERLDTAPRRDPLAAARAAVDERPTFAWTVAGLAERCLLGPDHFAVRFRAATGMPPMRWVQERRVALAAERLLATDERIDAIARSCGFANRHHFTRVFAKRMGVAPATYRRTRRT